ncbi:MAG: hypothetical protein QGF90_08725 [Gammaproteobacteria bacterium]|jgi:hypothetical protein|nr:hypothetical protein [Gammaproteobacteria bacterium]
MSKNQPRYPDTIADQSIFFARDLVVQETDYRMLQADWPGYG